MECLIKQQAGFKRAFFYVLPFFCFIFEKALPEEGHVSVEFRGQLGNQLFQIATAYVYSLDHALTLTIPDLVHKKNDNISFNAEALFLTKIFFYPPPFKDPLIWWEPSFNYTQIPDFNEVELHGHFQSEKYFKHRRKEVLDLFAPPPEVKEKIFDTYPILHSDKLIVGIQIRDYRKEFPRGDHHPTIGRDYYKKAMALFPKDTIFLISSNNPKYARDCVKGLGHNIFYLRDSSNYIEQFYTLSFCDSFIIANSSFGWWAAWLSQSSDKVVIAPTPWFTSPYDNKQMIKDVFPEGWIVMEYKEMNKDRSK